MTASPRLFVEHDLGTGALITLDEAKTGYLVRVLRLGIGSGVRVFNGRDGEWFGTLATIGKRSCELVLDLQTVSQRPVPDVWLVFAPLKKARTDFLVEKATELGASRLCPVMTRFTNSERLRTDRLHALATEAAEQTERLDVPWIDEPQPLHRRLAVWPSDRALVFADELVAGSADQDALSRMSGITGRRTGLLVGPEGGFSEEERMLLRTHPNVITVSLGPRILRAETAAIALLTLWQSRCGDWNAAGQGVEPSRDGLDDGGPVV